MLALDLSDRALPAGERATLLLFYDRGLTALEIARAARLRVGAAKSRIRLGLVTVGEHLSEAA